MDDWAEEPKILQQKVEGDDKLFNKFMTLLLE